MNKKEVEKKVLEFQRWVLLLIFFYAINLKSKEILIQKIRSKIKTIKLPKDLQDRELYYRGLEQSSLKAINKIYVPIVYNFTKVSGSKIKNLKGEEIIATKPKDLWATQKGSPNVYDYQNTLRKALKGLDKNKMVVSEAGKKPISLFQKVELDLRYNAQMEMVEKCYESGRDLWWFSSHPNCSKRCEKWQGKLVSLTLGAIDQTLWTGKRVNGNKVYSFQAIENQIDKYGYKNNIICGFNCRHRMIPYGGEQKVPPEEFNAKEVALKRKQEAYLRELERKIRKIKTKYEALKLVDKDQAKEYYKIIKKLKAKYIELCHEWGFAVEEYRL